MSRHVGGGCAPQSRGEARWVVPLNSPAARLQLFLNLSQKDLPQIGKRAQALEFKTDNVDVHCKFERFINRFVPGGSLKKVI